MSVSAAEKRQLLTQVKASGSMYTNTLHSIVIQNISPKPEPFGPAKRVLLEQVEVEADIFTDPHTKLEADLIVKAPGLRKTTRIPFHPLVNDRFKAVFVPDTPGTYSFFVEAWVNPAALWQEDLRKKQEARLDLTVDLQIGAALLVEVADLLPPEESVKLLQIAKKLREQKGAEAVAFDPEIARLGRLARPKSRQGVCSQEQEVFVTRKKALFSTWYELFPRSCSGTMRHGTFNDVVAKLPRISRMGFDVLYLPPIHPIGKTKRKGKNNALTALPDDPGSPWAVGSHEGGHDAIQRELGTLADFERLVKEAESLGIEIALDIALQCSPDHPYLKEHPEWFLKRPDGTYQYAENPPKKYEDIIPFHFTEDNKDTLFREILRIFLFWMKRGVRIFRVDNPHTKPFALWEYVIGEVRKVDSGVIFLAEAFTRPKIMHHLARIGFDQSYTYFTWRNTKWELTEYLTELTKTEARNYLRPNFFVNTPDILPESLQWGGRAAFLTRLILAATLSSSYGIYGPAFEQMLSEAVPGKEDYIDSEKYEIKPWDFEKKGTISETIEIVNRIRKENPALQATGNLEFYATDNDYLLAYGKQGPQGESLLIVVNLDHYHTQSGYVTLPLMHLGIQEKEPYLVDDLLSGERYIWEGERNYIQLSPHLVPAHIFRIRPKMLRENNFDYFI
ncbi:alpha-1,4-glucan--maltose-1-phosphate maltosyltransferase [Estrella lausannensis]|uniref:Alpha-1,4-glucan:maltose-1-phosphate maltosyltransferase n=1 Tax=Estrella lausannensis TaxID=483423 RepID=A0A0H5DRC6_9BACT|nr:alpha-1,4-glucan--maltose-1-phosphate maltosyltransferase [Estrella lausannensis]CRX38224.1 Glycosyl hydrolase [Estrella lausannensis]